MKKSMCDAPSVRFSSKSCSGGCGKKTKCAKCKAEANEMMQDKPDGDRDDSMNRYRSMPAIMTDAMDTNIYRNDAPTCKSGNKPCGNRCIPQEYDCSISQAIRKRHKGYVKNNIGAGIAGVGAGALLSAAGNATGGKKAALTAAGLVSGAGAAAMGGRAVYHAMKYGSNQLAQAENEKSGVRKGLRKLVGYGNMGHILEPDGPSYTEKKKKKGRGDSIWASGFETEYSESF